MANVFGLCDGAAIAFRQPIFAPKLHKISEVEYLTSSRTIANTLLAAVLLFDFDIKYIH